ncbi:Cytochrome c oxidase polypeptide IV [Cystobacter fuscus DSM 2262]|uniref:Cytochrome c oxidase polypeptide IV n=1 Tax=Cystobacter fuscus (strain ATCC 25194 / DSM 2262 / NBRC 100088 / M29) TaxID=1242864 RepID=S9PI33_CYSF2|nr:cytochrome C oxidase subunit IV family protein [Cystobacter fuscus]EPX63990.1 Cytochrome c oxidase polypeptide IV [Cystobacter fuscus DSM 2262]
MAEHGRKSAWGYVGVWGVLVVLTVATWLLGTRGHLGHWSLPVAVGIALAKTALVAMFFMHLVEQPGARRVVFPVSALFLALLLGLSLVEAMTRVRMARPDGPKALEPARPGSTRTAPPGSPTRWMGN